MQPCLLLVRAGSQAVYSVVLVDRTAFIDTRGTGAPVWSTQHPTAVRRSCLRPTGMRQGLCRSVHTSLQTTPPLLVLTGTAKGMVEYIWERQFALALLRESLPHPGAQYCYSSNAEALVFASLNSYCGRKNGLWLPTCRSQFSSERVQMAKKNMHEFSSSNLFRLNWQILAKAQPAECFQPKALRTAENFKTIPLCSTWFATYWWSLFCASWTFLLFLGRWRNTKSGLLAFQLTGWLFRTSAELLALLEGR